MKLLNTIVLFILLIVFSLCTKPQELPTVSTIGVKDIGINSAAAFGSITGSDITAKGICWDTIVNPTIEKKFSNEGEGSKSFSTALTNLLPNKKYYVRAYATNEQGTAYGDSKGFNTLTAPIVITNSLVERSFDYAIVSGSISGNAISSLFAGICLDTKTNPDTINNRKILLGTDSTFRLSLTNLNANTSYYYRAFVVYSFGIIYGATKSFTTSSVPLGVTLYTTTGTMMDLDGNVYKTITIGGQTWMAENLRTTQYRNGTPISYIPGSNWSSDNTGAYNYYSNQSTLTESYGAYYNHYAIRNASGIAPVGWHVPTANEWGTLVNNLSIANPSYSSFVQLVDGSSGNWLSLSCTPYNFSNMKINPLGYKNSNANLNSFGSGAFFWTADGTSNYASNVYFTPCATSFGSFLSTYGMNVRLVKD